jgi:hypothetical protein
VVAVLLWRARADLCHGAVIPTAWQNTRLPASMRSPEPEPLLMFEETVFGPFSRAVCREAFRAKQVHRYVRLQGSER